MHLKEKETFLILVCLVARSCGEWYKILKKHTSFEGGDRKPSSKNFTISTIVRIGMEGFVCQKCLAKMAAENDRSAWGGYKT